MRNYIFFLAIGFSGFVAATAAQALDTKPQGPSQCDRQVQQCVERCRGEVACTSHCTAYPCGSRFPVAGTVIMQGGATGASPPAKPVQRHTAPMKILKAAPTQ